MVNLNATTHYGQKDQTKANISNKFIGQGSLRSSTNKYEQAYKTNANCGEYVSTDIVFVSAEGNRRGRLNPPFEELQLACDAGVTFITDDESNRNRPYNIGERQVAEFLEKNSYHVVESKHKCSAWQPI